MPRLPISSRAYSITRTQTSSSPEQLRGEAVLVGSSVRASVNSRAGCVQSDQTVVASCVRDALAAATRPHDLRISLQQAGLPVGALDTLR